MTSGRRVLAGLKLHSLGQIQSSEPTPERYGLFTFGDSRPPGDYDLDIVAVHGLGGDWEASWTHENGKLWLRDFLPSQLPKARIMSYGYGSATTFSVGVTDINDEATMLLYRLRGARRDGRTRPIIFACHSIGGIVVKRACILAHKCFDLYGDLLSSIRGCLFFGVPHSGATNDYWGGLASRITKILQLGGSTNTNFIKAMVKNSEFLDETSRQFAERAVQLTIRTFYETTQLNGSLIVDKDSARLNLRNEIVVGIPDANHRTVCKFGDATSQQYLLVQQAIWYLVDSAITGSGPSTVTPVAVTPATGIKAPKPLSTDEIERTLYTSDYDSQYLRVPRPVAASRELVALSYKMHTLFFGNSVVHQREHLPIGLHFGERWNKLRSIGEGGQGEVYLEARENTDQLRAVKKISQHLMRVHGLKIERELDTLIAVNTYANHFVHFLGWYEDKDFIYLAMEYVPHGNLGQYMKENPAESRQQAQRISKQLLTGIAILHQMQICHRDVKPENVLVAKPSPIQLKIADFGISKCTVGTQLRTKHGTTNYMAPEMHGLLPRSLHTGDQYTNAVDMWALGCLIHEILTSTIPFQEGDLDTKYSGVTMSGYKPQLDTFTLSEFCKGSIDLPIEMLSSSQATEQSIDFIRRLLVVNPRSRMSAGDALEHEWLNG